MRSPTGSLNRINIARYRIRLADYWAWLNALKANAGS